MDTRKAPRSLAVLLSLAFALGFVLIAAPASADPKTEAAAKVLQKKAMEEDYLATDFAKAQQKLDQAIQQCGADKCSAQVRALLHRDLGVVLIGGQVDRAKGVAAFVEAIKLDDKTGLDPDLRTKELDAAWAEAKKKAASGGGGGGGGGAGPVGEQPQGDFTHTPAAEQQIRTPIPVYAEYSGEEQLTKVIARYKGFGMTEWKSIELTKKGDKGWGGLIPCADVQQGTTQYYLQGFNANNDPVATGGDRNHPYKVPVKREAVAEAPHLPNEAPPKQCADTGDCPPNFPGCHEQKATEGPTGKDGGEFCEEDSECKSKECKQNKCTAPEGAKKAKRIWVGIWGAFDYSFLPSSDDVCKLKPTNQNQEPLNDANYYCTESGSSDDYPYRLAGPGDKVPPGRGDNNNVVTGQSDKVSGGGAFGNIRIMASLDFAVNNNLLIGGRVGYVLLAYPGQAAKDDGKTFPPLHLELRGTYLIGKDALLQKLAPYVMVGGGVSTWDAAVKVSVVEQNTPAPGQKSARDVDAWHIGGPAFITFGGGARIGFNDTMALMAGLRVNLAFGNAFAPSAGPEVGFVIGF